MIGKIVKTAIWWVIIAVIIIFFLQGNVIDSPKAFIEWAQLAVEDVKKFYDSTIGQIDFSKINLNGEEIDVPQESE
jgi:hypothetical protein